jgi:hypothetical protein
MALRLLRQRVKDSIWSNLLVCMPGPLNSAEVHLVSLLEGAQTRPETSGRESTYCEATAGERMQAASNVPSGFAHSNHCLSKSGASQSSSMASREQLQAAALRPFRVSTIPSPVCDPILSHSESKSTLSSNRGSLPVNAEPLSRSGTLQPFRRRFSSLAMRCEILNCDLNQGLGVHPLLRRPCCDESANMTSCCRISSQQMKVRKAFRMCGVLLRWSWTTALDDLKTFVLVFSYHWASG